MFRARFLDKDFSVAFINSGINDFEAACALSGDSNGTFQGRDEE